MAEEITVNSMYDISMRGITNTNLPLFKGVDREVCINIDDNYRPTVFNGKTLGGINYCLMKSDLDKTVPSLTTMSGTYVAKSGSDMTGTLSFNGTSKILNSGNDLTIATPGNLKVNGKYVPLSINGVSPDPAGNVTISTGIINETAIDTQIKQKAVLITTDQTVAGTKTFTSNVIAPSVVTPSIVSSGTQLISNFSNSLGAYIDLHATTHTSSPSIASIGSITATSRTAISVNGSSSLAYLVRYASATATSPTISTPLVTADIQQNITAKHNYVNGILVNGHTITIG